jgi:uncharacterized protein GlcG (DUF336 family)
VSITWQIDLSEDLTTAAGTFTAVEDLSFTVGAGQIVGLKILDKAKTAALFRRPSKVFFDAMESGHPYVATFPGLVAADGGLPIIENGKVIGAIGVSGGTGAQDAVVAKAGADTVK